MVTLSEYKVIYREYYERMMRVKRLASALKDGRFWFGATSFRLEVKSYIETMEKVYTAYTTAPSFASKDFTSALAKLKHEVEEKEATLKRVKEISDAQ
ncbi:MAG: hypothetical protein IJD51_03655 [Clostridia bacterium]|nr:hypothetical protein [Clostridia bacterium]